MSDAGRIRRVGNAGEARELQMMERRHSVATRARDVALARCGERSKPADQPKTWPRRRRRGAGCACKRNCAQCKLRWEPRRSEGESKRRGGVRRKDPAEQRRREL